MQSRRIAAYPPLIGFWVVYIGTCLVGDLILMSNWGGLTIVYEYFSGTQVPVLHGRARATLLVLLMVAPLLLSAGYVLALKAPGSVRSGARARRWIEREFPSPPARLAAAMFIVSAAVAIKDVVLAAGITHAGAWFDYHSWIDARQRAFSSVSTLGFVNVYLVLPLSAAALTAVAPERSTAVRTWLLRLVPVAVTVAVSSLLFQKKAAMVSILLIGCTFVLVHARRHPPRRLKRVALGGCAAAASIYIAMVAVPVAHQGTHDLVDAVGYSSRVTRLPSVVVYSLLAPITRTSAPTLYYPIVYPGEQPFHGIDVGQDVLGIGTASNDNIVVWRAMNPTLAGTSAAPYQFNLYSQDGVTYALLGSLAVGYVLGILWRSASVMPEVWRALGRSIAILLGVYLAIDSARNDVLATYGVGWALVFVVAFAVLTRFVHREAVTRSASRRARARVD